MHNKKRGGRSRKRGERRRRTSLFSERKKGRQKGAPGVGFGIQTDESRALEKDRRKGKKARKKPLLIENN